MVEAEQEEKRYNVAVYVINQEQPIRWPDISEKVKNEIVTALAETKCYRTSTNNTLIMSDKVIWVSARQLPHPSEASKE